MPGLSPKVAMHRLAVKKGVSPKKQPQRRFRSDLIPEIEKEVNKLIETGFIREVTYPTWIAIIVPVRKKNGQLRVCVDFWDLNDAFPKDDFSLPVTEFMIDATTRHEDFFFMDCTAGYNQILIAPEDQEATAFRTPKGIFCYKVRPFGLKNAGATYQRAMQRIFDDILHKTIKFYVDDVVVKSKKREDHINDLRTIFERLGIEVNQSKIKAIQEMLEPKNLKELRGLQGRLAYIRSIKKYLSSAPVLGAPVPGKPLILYIAAQERSLGALYAQENEYKKERAFYYLSRTLVGAELNYSPIEKICLALVFAIQKLRHYMQDDLIGKEIFYVDVLPPWQMYFDGAATRDGAGTGVVFLSPEGHMLPYSFVLTEMCSNNVAEYQALILGLQMAIEIGVKDLDIYGDSLLVANQVLDKFKVKKDDLIPYHQYVIQLLNKFDYVHIGHVPRSAKKMADALANLTATLALGAEEVTSIPVCNRWVVLLLEGGEITESSNMISVYQVDNDDWRQPIIDFLEHQKLPDDPRHKVEIHRHAPRFIYYKGTLYKRSFLGQWPRCLGETEASEATYEAHLGVCGTYQSNPKLHDRVKRMGYYWPTMVQDCMYFAKKCDACQFNENFIHQPPEPLHPTILSWPFEMWGLDVIGPTTPKASNSHEFILAATDYFSIWQKLAVYAK
ncbi:uncharacterized protein LOC141630515 [Silene latifolia]|uniref:uncharacterized protein LOC141630515 n=1 Tax=Silene latifolia TaxID=37657 RepID=UPI003D76B49C